MRKLLFVFLFTLVCFVGNAAQGKCDGMCGYKFGEIVNSWDSTADTGLKIKIINPKKKFMSFNKYLLSLTPKSLKVAAIYMLVEFENIDKAKNEFEKVDKVLTSHYGVEGQEKINFLGKVKEYHVNGGEVAIILIASYGDTFNGQLFLTAISLSNTLIGKKEANEVLINETDTSALD